MKQYLKEILILVVSLLLYSLILLTKNEILISVVLLLIILISFKFVYYKKEWRVFILGILVGFVLEVSGDLIYKLQFWESGLIFGKPIWLFLLWGFLFIQMRRMGNLIIGKK